MPPIAHAREGVQCHRPGLLWWFRSSPVIHPCQLLLVLVPSSCSLSLHPCALVVPVSLSPGRLHVVPSPPLSSSSSLVSFSPSCPGCPGCPVILVIAVSTHNPPHGQLLTVVFAGAGSFLLWSCWRRLPLAHVLVLAFLSSSVAPIIHPVSSCSQQWGWVLGHLCWPVVVSNLNYSLKKFVNRKKKSQTEKKKLTYGPRDIVDVPWAFF